MKGKSKSVITFFWKLSVIIQYDTNEHKNGIRIVGRFTSAIYFSYSIGKLL